MKRLLLILTIFAFLTSTYLEARPGGGHSFRWKSKRSYRYYKTSPSTYRHSNLPIGVFFLGLPPEIIAMIIIFGIIVYSASKTSAKEEKFTFVAKTDKPIPDRIVSISKMISQLKVFDPNFSRILFLDFVSSLYTKFYQYQNNKKLLKTLNPFFDKNLLNKFLNDKHNFQISQIVIGAIYIEKISFIENYVKIFVRFNSNLTITDKQQHYRIILDERWTLQREKNVLSPEPEKMHTVSCPYCGAPADFTDAGYCKHCGQLVVQGKNQWYVTDRHLFSVEYLTENKLFSYAPEAGTDLPTIFDPFLPTSIKNFEQIHNVNWLNYSQKFKQQIVQKYFDAIYKAWSSLNWHKVRHLLSDRLWEAYNFWIETFKQYNVKNVLDIKITEIEFVKIEIDKFYEAITVRIWAKGLDYIEDYKGKLVAGSKTIPRKFSEYWTFVRRIGVETDDYDIQTCPACGAPADKIGQTGICEYCGNKITWGDFSWILALITQDENYKG